MCLASQKRSDELSFYILSQASSRQGCFSRQTAKEVSTHVPELTSPMLGRCFQTKNQARVVPCTTVPSFLLDSSPYPSSHCTAHNRPACEANSWPTYGFSETRLRVAPKERLLYLLSNQLNSKGRQVSTDG